MGEAGEKFLNQLSQLTGAVVAAATTAIGQGQWHLSSVLSSQLAFSAETQRTYQGIFKAAIAQASALSRSLSAGGRYVTFDSDASDLVDGDTNSARDVFVYDCQEDTLKRISVDRDGNESNGISLSPSFSADGQYVAFESNASNLVV